MNLFQFMCIVIIAGTVINAPTIFLRKVLPILSVFQNSVDLNSHQNCPFEAKKFCLQI